MLNAHGELSISFFFFFWGGGGEELSFGWEIPGFHDLSINPCIERPSSAEIVALYSGTYSGASLQGTSWRQVLCPLYSEASLQGTSWRQVLCPSSYLRGNKCDPTTCPLFRESNIKSSTIRNSTVIAIEKFRCHTKESTVSFCGMQHALRLSLWNICTKCNIRHSDLVREYGYTHNTLTISVACNMQQHGI